MYYIIIESIITLKKPLLYQSVTYNFTLTLGVDDNYKKNHNEEPPSGFANIIVYNGLSTSQGNFEKELRIK